MLGNGRLEAYCFDGEKRLAHIRGKLRKKVWVNQGDIILVSLREYQDAKADVILKYSADEARSLKAYSELPDTAKINETDTYVFMLSLIYTEYSRSDTNIFPLATGVRVRTTSSSSTKIVKTVTTRKSTLMRFKRFFSWPPIKSLRSLYTYLASPIS